MTPRELFSGRVGALAGVAFVLLFFLSTAMVDQPKNSTDAELLEWWSDDANLTSVLVSTYLHIGAAICLLVFVTAVRAVSLRAEGGNGSLTTLAFTVGVIFIALMLVGAGSRGVTAAGVKLNDEPLPSADLLRYLPQLGYIILGTIGGVVAGVTALVNSALIVRTGAFRRWLGIVGLVCGVGCVALALTVGPFFIPVMLIWVLATSVALWRTHASEAATVARPRNPAAATA